MTKKFCDWCTKEMSDDESKEAGCIDFVDEDGNKKRALIVGELHLECLIKVVTQKLEASKIES